MKSLVFVTVWDYYELALGPSYLTLIPLSVTLIVPIAWLRTKVLPGNGMQELIQSRLPAVSMLIHNTHTNP